MACTPPWDVCPHVVCDPNDYDDDDNNDDGDDDDDDADDDLGGGKADKLVMSTPGRRPEELASPLQRPSGVVHRHDCRFRRRRALVI